MATILADPRAAPAPDPVRDGVQPAAAAAFRPGTDADAPSRYGESSRHPLLIAVVLVHALLILALIKLDVIHHHGRHAHRLVVMDIKPVETTPPPPVAQPQPQPKVAMPRIETPIVAPPPIVATPAAPPPVLASPSPPPPSPQPVAAAPAPAIAAPIVPPDGMAATLGNTAPRYPLESRRQHEEGTVRLRVLISVEGAVQEIAVAKSSGFDRLDKAALEAVRRWKFKPGTQAGKAVEAVGFLSIPFALTRA